MLHMQPSFFSIFFLFKIILYVKMIIVKYVLYAKYNIGMRKYLFISNLLTF